MPSARQVAIWLYRGVGAAVAIALMEVLAQLTDEPLARVPFVTSIVLTISLPDSEAAQPYAVVAGHLLSTAAGFAALWCLGAGTTAGRRCRLGRIADAGNGRGASAGRN